MNSYKPNTMKRDLIVCDNCGRADCWNPGSSKLWFVCEKYKAAGTTTRSEYERRAQQSPFPKEPNSPTRK